MAPCRKDIGRQSLQSFGPEGHLVSVHSDEQVRYWSTNSQSASETFPLAPFLRKGSFSQLPVISADGRWGAAQGSREHISYTWDARQLESFASPAGLYQTNLIFIWDMKTGKLAAALPDTTNCAYPALAFSLDGERVAIGGETLASLRDSAHKSLPAKTPRGVVQVWNWRKGQLIWQTKTPKGVTGLCWSGNDQLSVVGGNLVVKQNTAYDVGGELAVWAPDQGKRLMRRHLDSKPEAVAFSGNGRWVVVVEGFGGINVWNARTGKLHKLLKCPVYGDHGNLFEGSPPLEQVVVSIDSRLIAGLGSKSLSSQGIISCNEKVERVCFWA